MVTALQSKAQLSLLADDAADTAKWMVRRSNGQWESRRLQLLDTVPGVVAYYSEGSAALAADFYDDSRTGVAGNFAATPVVLDRTVKIRRGVAWASFPLSVDDDDLATLRMAKLVQSEVVRPYRDTILSNGKADDKYVGWSRVTSPGACSFCRALADRGAVYKKDTARFAAHDDCKCTAQPWFDGQQYGPEADVLQYAASGRRKRTAKDRDAIKAWISAYED